MLNDESMANGEARMPSRVPALIPLCVGPFVIGYWPLIRHSAFVLRHLLAAVAAGLLSFTPVQAGLYNTAEPDESPLVAQGEAKALSFTPFRSVLSALVQIGVGPVGLGQPENLQRKHYLAERDKLQAKARAGSITVQERVNLSAYLIRLRQHDEAVELLQRAAGQERGNFMLFSNLGTAHQLSGRLDRAQEYLQQVKLLWPREWPGLNKAQLDWYRQAERYHLELIKLRYRESLGQSKVRPKPPETVDDLFRGEKGSVRFVGESGQYEAGKLAAKEREKLPGDARAIVQQLLLWLPDDTRLYWLLGELDNADGDVDAAAKIFDDCVWSRRSDAAALKAHLQIVREARPKGDSINLEPVAPGITAASPKPAQSTEDSSWLPQTRQLLVVGGAVGVVVVLLGYFQIREFRKRRRHS